MRSHSSYNQRTILTKMSDMVPGDWGIIIQSPYENLIGELVIVDGVGVCHHPKKVSTFACLSDHTVQLFDVGDELQIQF